MASELKPRLCVMKKGENGYGFHLHGEKGKTGQYIRKVERASPAEASGLRAGDRVVEVNGENAERETHHQVHHTPVLHPHKSSGTSHTCAPPSQELSLLLALICALPVFPAGGERPVSEVQPSSESSTRDPSELLPRLCHLVRSETGYGFNLHSERSRPGQYIRALDPSSPADRAGLKPQDRLIEFSRESSSHLLDPFEETGLCLSPTAAEAKEKAHAKRTRKRAPQMDWNKKHEIFSNF
ncbi:Na(+)/H(+) exchange regulatory cofactor NHE-RF2-like [Sinocyclocheilus grahami]|uniref:Na(+)/H(+) exchange regulatory cofactor NHE-RF2-like n=1 Tax=Sinocyclocheilus grahami TaxID=75366 RepID=UPI0007AC8059|nr:PREDICTED: Na(+)/H(+) exchange regulatory cofactor NHE-RF2-like [Sinocyclocheilus grahami]